MTDPGSPRDRLDAIAKQADIVAGQFEREDRAALAREATQLVERAERLREALDHEAAGSLRVLDLALEDEASDPLDRAFGRDDERGGGDR